MTPLGLHLRKLRQQRGITQKEMAEGIGVSAAYLSALENGKRGKPPWALVQRLAGYLNVIWDDAEKLQRLARLSDPKVTIDTSALSPASTELANLLAEQITNLDEAAIAQLITLIRDLKKPDR